LKKRWMNVLRIVISVGALAFLFWKIGLGETLDALRHAQVGYLLIALALFVISLVVRAFRWRVLLEGLHIQVPFGRLVRLYFVGQFFSSFLPSQFGGDVVRAAELTQDTPSSAAIGTVLVDRMTGLIMLFAMSLAVLPFQAGHLEPWLVWLLLGVGGAGLIVGLLLLDGRVLRWLTAKLPAKLSLSGEGTLARIYAAVTGCGWRAVLNAFGVSMVFNVLNILIHWLCGRAVGMHLSLGYFFVVIPLFSVGGLIPSIGGWGVREAVSTAVFSPAGVDANVAAALGVSMGPVGLAVGLCGGVLYAIQGARGLRARR